MQLSENSNPAATCAVDWDYGLQTDLEIASNPNHAGIDGAGGRIGIAEIVRDRRREVHFDDRNQMIGEIWKLQVNDFGLQVLKAVLQLRAIDELLRNKDALGEVERARRNLIADLPGHRERASPRNAFWKLTEALADIKRRGERTVGCA